MSARRVVQKPKGVMHVSSLEFSQCTCPMGTVGGGESGEGEKVDEGAVVNAVCS